MIRWLRWNLVCRRGRNCALLDISNVGEVPAGAMAVLGWTCGGCFTTYKRSLLVGDDGSFTLTDPERINVGRSTGIIVGPGETIELMAPYHRNGQ